MTVAAWTTEILGPPEEQYGCKVVPYRHVDRDGADETRYAEVCEPLPVEIMADRWEGLMHDKNNPSKFQNRLDRILWDLSEALARRTLNDDTVMVDGRIDGIDFVVPTGELETIIRDWMIEHTRKVAR